MLFLPVGGHTPKGKGFMVHSDRPCDLHQKLQPTICRYTYLASKKFLKFFVCCNIFRTMKFQIKISRFSLKIGRSGKISLHDRAGADKLPPRARTCALQTTKVQLLPSATCMRWPAWSQHAFKIKVLLHRVMPNFINWGVTCVKYVLRESNAIASEK